MTLIATRDPTEAVLNGCLVTPRDPKRAERMAAQVTPRAPVPVKPAARIFFDPENQPRGLVGQLSAEQEWALEAAKLAKQEMPDPERKPGEVRDKPAKDMNSQDRLELVTFLVLLGLIANAPEPGQEPRQDPEPKLEPVYLVVKTLREVAEDLCARHEMSLGLLKSKQRCRDVCAVRFEGMYLMRVHCKASLPQIGRFFDRDHTSVLHACETHANRHGLPKPWKGGQG
ncbi:chromosomal replication initiation protein [Roseibium album]|nr:chromosomal replication initiation protein [Roseibium album]